MSMSQYPKGIAWNKVALVGFENNKPVLITTIEPGPLFETLSSLLREEFDFPQDDEESGWDWDDEISLQEIRMRIGDMQWQLYPVEIAKRVFCSRFDKHDSDEKPPSNKPLPGQLSMPFPEEE